MHADLRPLPFAALLIGLGLMLFFWGHVDVWQLNTNQRIVMCVRSRILDEFVEESFPFDSVAAVKLTSPDRSEGETRYQVDLILHSGRTIFISSRRRHAGELAALLGVPTRSGLVF